MTAGHVGAAASFIGIDCSAQIGNARQPVRRVDADPAHPCFDCVGLRMRGLALPTQLRLFERAAGRIARDLIAPCRLQRQVSGQRTPGLERQSLGRDFAARRALAVDGQFYR